MSQISAGQTSTLSAFFDSQHEAQRAADRLIEAGLTRESVRLVPGYEGDAPIAERTEHHRGFFQALADFFMPNEDRYSYAEGLNRGGFLVVASNLTGAQYDRAVDILDDEGAVDFDAREESWRSEGWGGYEAGYESQDRARYVAGADRTDSDLDADRIDTVDAVSPHNDRGFGLRDSSLNRPRVRSYLNQEYVDRDDVEIEDDRAALGRLDATRR